MTEKDNGTKKRKYRGVDQNMEDDISLSTTDSDRLELLKIIKKRKLTKQNKRQQFNSFAMSCTQKKYDELATIVSNDGSTFQQNT
jgi:hypothetical protein